MDGTLTRLIVDSGSTKTDWLFMAAGRLETVTTGGINAAIQSDGQIYEVVKGELSRCMTEKGISLPWLGSDGELADIHYYGAGCAGGNIPRVEAVLRKAFGGKARVEADSDLMGAALALVGDGEGIACILGTGSNSCLFSRRRIVRQTPSLGYILGDEGSGAALGRSFLNALLKGMLPKTAEEAFAEECRLTLPVILEKVYRQALPNRFLASMSLFISRHLDIPEVEGLVTANFMSFIERNILPYGRADLPVNAVGSVGAVYEKQLRKAAEAFGMTIGKVERSPLGGLAAYYRHS